MSGIHGRATLAPHWRLSPCCSGMRHCRPLRITRRAPRRCRPRRVLDNGLYVLIASHDPSFKERDNKVSAVVIWVSDLAMVIRPLRDSSHGRRFRAGRGNRPSDCRCGGQPLDVPLRRGAISTGQPNTNGREMACSGSRMKAPSPFCLWAEHGDQNAGH